MGNHDGRTRPAGGVLRRVLRRPVPRRDLLTGTSIRPEWLRRLEHASATAARLGSPVAVLALQLDDFPAPDAAPHSSDEVLVTVADRLARVLRGTDVVCRYAPTEFLLLAEHVDGDAGAAVVADRALAAVRDPIRAGDGACRVTASVGIALGPAEEVTELVDDARRMRRVSADAGGDTYRFAGRDAPSSTLDDLRRALDRDELRLWYQPQVELRHGRVVAAEALLRWRQGPDTPLVPAGRFLSLTENTELGWRIGRWALDRAVHDARTWNEQRQHAPTAVAVNLGAHHLLHGDAVADVKDALQQHGVPPDQLELEVPEQAFGRAPREVADVVGDLAGLGVRVVLDGFGMGQSSLGLLPGLPIHALKLDESLGDHLAGRGAGLVAGLVGLARELGLDVVVPRIEHVGQLRRARQLGCHRAQGHLLSPPLPARSMTGSRPPTIGDAATSIRRG